MKVEHLKQAPFNTTLLGVLRGVADFYGVTASDAMLYGVTGHAFVINIHDQLCPSGPYCWERAGFHRLVRNLGIEMVDHGFFGGDSTSVDRQRLEQILQQQLDAGRPCSLMNLENQMITGYDDTGFVTAQPWAPKVDFPPAHLEFGTWDEFGTDCHANFYSFNLVDPAAPLTAVSDSLAYAIDLFEHSATHTSPPYGIGPDAYENFISAVTAGAGDSHGNWWNATVWAECRQQAGAYFDELSTQFEQIAPTATQLAEHFRTVSAGLLKVSDKSLEAAEKIDTLKSLKDQELAAVGPLRSCLEDLRQATATIA